MSQDQEPPGPDEPEEIGEAVVATDHTHGDAEFDRKSKEGEDAVAVFMMADQQIYCDNLGVHRHGDHSQLHHHHDLTCLIEAGANQYRPLLDTVDSLNTHNRVLKGLLEEKTKDNRSLVAQVAEQLHDLESLHGLVDLYSESAMDVARFMSVTPAQGPWRTVLEQYDQWGREESQDRR